MKILLITKRILEENEKLNTSAETDIIDSDKKDTLTIAVDSNEDENSLRFQTPRNFSLEPEFEIEHKNLFYSYSNSNHSNQEIDEIEDIEINNLAKSYSIIDVQRKEIELAYQQGNYLEEDFDRIWGISQRIMFKEKLKVEPKTKSTLLMHNMIDEIDKEGVVNLNKKLKIIKRSNWFEKTFKKIFRINSEKTIKSNFIQSQKKVAKCIPKSQTTLVNFLT
jgi:hypothetical protein